MPYKLNGNCVVKADTGAVVKCHKTRGLAEAHLAALMVNVPDASGKSKSNSGGSAAAKQMNEIMRQAAGKKK